MSPLQPSLRFGHKIEHTSLSLSKVEPATVFGLGLFDSRSYPVMVKMMGLAVGHAEIVGVARLTTWDKTLEQTVTYEPPAALQAWME